MIHHRKISIHALLAESDFSLRLLRPTFTVFLSTLSLRRATAAARLTAQQVVISIHALLAESDIDFSIGSGGSGDISIHALLAESDDFWSKPAVVITDFYPRSPCGERRRCAGIKLWLWIFLSTLSLRRATPACPLPCQALLHFYPRSPCGERRPCRRL